MSNFRLKLPQKIPFWGSVVPQNMKSANKLICDKLMLKPKSAKMANE